MQRQKRSYDALQPTQQWKRRKQLRSVIAEASQQISCPVEALRIQQRTTPEKLLHLTTAERERIRTVSSLHIPCEQTMIACKQQLATSHATETGTFAGGAYVTDPVRFVSVLCAQSSFVAVGGDAGGSRCVLGVTYSIPTPTRDNPKKTTQHFACLFVYEGGDSWLELQDCRAEGLTPFTGDSAAFPHIWAVLQHLIDEKKVGKHGQTCVGKRRHGTAHLQPYARIVLMCILVHSCAFFLLPRPCPYPCPALLVTGLPQW